ncbi:gas vesicle accessory protein GvpU [Leclercia adecarboxylata]|uniref:gas vesicle accessory protein GvpU n=1 Tax=Leclercia adecarboxylata TaxID=83655 RepID=UPI0021D276CB|nr:gas vesicle accessory protein GvpU [Leclercia adecarboxylata]MCU6674660.1 gas vesicle protein [Leclercia adecarboxylata]
MEQTEIREVISRSIYDNDLGFLAELIEKLDIEIGITLMVKGLLVSGMLVSGKKYYTQVSEQLQSSGEAAKAISQYFSAKAENFGIEKPEEAEFNFLNLINIAFLKGDGQMGEVNGGRLRLKLEEVDGYILGKPSNSQ